MVFISPFVSVCLYVCVCVQIFVNITTLNYKKLGDERGITPRNDLYFSTCLFSSWAERRENLLQDLNDSSFSFGMK